MKIIKRLADAVVLYAGELTLDAQRASNGDWSDQNTTTQNAVLVDGVTLPADWRGGNYTYSGTWARTAQGQAAYELAQAEAQANLIEAVRMAVQDRMDTFALSHGYGSSGLPAMLSLCSYATSTNAKFAAEGQNGIALRDAHWQKCYEIENAVISGARPMPTLDEVLGEMPALTWPN